MTCNNVTVVVSCSFLSARPCCHSQSLAPRTGPGPASSVRPTQHVVHGLTRPSAAAGLRCGAARSSASSYVIKLSVL